MSLQHESEIVNLCLSVHLLHTEVRPSVGDLHVPRKSTRKMKPSALFEDAVDKQVARKPAGKNALDDREGPDILGNWFLHHEKNEKQEPQDPPRSPT